MSETPEEQEPDSVLPEFTISDIMPETWMPGEIVYFGPDSRSILLNTDIDENSAAAVISQLRELNSRDEEPSIIKLYINTPGGGLIDALAIYDVIKILDSPVVGIVQGACMSAGLIVLSACDLRLATPQSRFFYHEPISTMNTITSSADLISSSEEYEWSKKRMEATMRSAMTISDKEWLEHFGHKTSKFFDAEFAKQFGLVEHILGYAEKDLSIFLEIA